MQRSDLGPSTDQGSRQPEPHPPKQSMSGSRESHLSQLSSGRTTASSSNPMPANFTLSSTSDTDGPFPLTPNDSPTTSSSVHRTGQVGPSRQRQQPINPPRPLPLGPVPSTTTTTTTAPTKTRTYGSLLEDPNKSFNVHDDADLKAFGRFLSVWRIHHTAERNSDKAVTDMVQATVGDMKLQTRKTLPEDVGKDHPARGVDEEGWEKIRARHMDCTPLFEVTRMRISHVGMVDRLGRRHRAQDTLFATQFARAYEAERRSERVRETGRQDDSQAAPVDKMLRDPDLVMCVMSASSGWRDEQFRALLRAKKKRLALDDGGPSQERSSKSRRLDTRNTQSSSLMPPPRSPHAPASFTEPLATLPTYATPPFPSSNREPEPSLRTCIAPAAATPTDSNAPTFNPSPPYGVLPTLPLPTVISAHSMSETSARLSDLPPPSTTIDESSTSEANDIIRRLINNWMVIVGLVLEFKCRAYFKGLCQLMGYMWQLNEVSGAVLGLLIVKQRFCRVVLSWAEQASAEGDVNVGERERDAKGDATRASSTSADKAKRQEPKLRFIVDTAKQEWIGQIKTMEDLNADISKGADCVPHSCWLEDTATEKSSDIDVDGIQRFLDFCKLARDHLKVVPLKHGWSWEMARAESVRLSDAARAALNDEKKAKLGPSAASGGPLDSEGKGRASQDKTSDGAKRTIGTVNLCMGAAREEATPPLPRPDLDPSQQAVPGRSGLVRSIHLIAKGARGLDEVPDPKVGPTRGKQRLAQSISSRASDAGDKDKDGGGGGEDQGGGQDEGGGQDGGGGNQEGGEDPDNGTKDDGHTHPDDEQGSDHDHGSGEARDAGAGDQDAGNEDHEAEEYGDEDDRHDSREDKGRGDGVGRADANIPPQLRRDAGRDQEYEPLTFGNLSRLSDMTGSRRPKAPPPSSPRSPSHTLSSSSTDSEPSARQRAHQADMSWRAVRNVLERQGVTVEFVSVEQMDRMIRAMADHVESRTRATATEVVVPEGTSRASGRQQEENRVRPSLSAKLGTATKTLRMDDRIRKTDTHELLEEEEEEETSPFLSAV